MNRECSFHARHLQFYRRQRVRAFQAHYLNPVQVGLLGKKEGSWHQAPLAMS